MPAFALAADRCAGGTYAGFAARAPEGEGRDGDAFEPVLVLSVRRAGKEGGDVVPALHVAQGAVDAGLSAGDVDKRHAGAVLAHHDQPGSVRGRVRSIKLITVTYTEPWLHASFKEFVDNAVEPGKIICATFFLSLGPAGLDPGPFYAEIVKDRPSLIDIPHIAVQGFKPNPDF